MKKKHSKELFKKWMEKEMSWKPDKELDKIERARIRISSLEPNLLTDEIIYFLSESNSFVPHLHLPLQSGSDLVLKRMRRRYSSDYYFSNSNFFIA